MKFGKNEEKVEGYSPYTVYGDNYRATKFDQWFWDQRGGYYVPPTQEDASAYLDEIAYSDKTQTVKGKIQEMLERYSNFLQHKYGQDEWEFSWSFDGGGGDSSQPRDYLTVEDRRKIRQAALEKGSISAGGSLTADGRKQWQGYIAQELDKPLGDISPRTGRKSAAGKSPR